jgi:hypothetical protein
VRAPALHRKGRAPVAGTAQPGGHNVSTIGTILSTPSGSHRRPAIYLTFLAPVLDRSWLDCRWQKPGRSVRSAWLNEAVGLRRRRRMPKQLTRASAYFNEDTPECTANAPLYQGISCTGVGKNFD